MLMRGRVDMRDESGQAFIVAVVFIPILVVFVSFAIDAANWFVHKRHLQNKADAAATAGASAMRDSLLSGGCASSAVETAVTLYGSTKNPHIAGSDAEGRTSYALNQANYTSQGGPGDSGLTGDPCTDKAVDVKVSERDQKWYFDIARVVPWINAQARMELKTLSGGAGTLPVMVEDASTKSVRVTFTDMATGAVLASRNWDDPKPGSGTLQLWGGAVPDVPVSASRISMDVALSSKKGVTDCADVNVKCYTSVGFVRGYATPDVTADAAPQAGDVRLLPASTSACLPDAYFSVAPAACNVVLHAQVAFNSTPKSATDVSVRARVGGQTYSLARPSPTAEPTRWETAIPLPAQAGALPITLEWTQTSGKAVVGGTVVDCKTGGNNPCKDQPLESGKEVQRPFTATESGSGPIRLAQIGDDVSTFGVNSVVRCATCTKSFEITIGVRRIDISAPTDPPIALRVGVTGQDTQSINCDPVNYPGKNMTEYMLANGCPPNYRINTGEDCTTWSTAKPILWPCAQIQGASQPSKISGGLNTRIHQSDSVCTSPSRWPNVTAGDPRLLPVFVVPLGSAALKDGSWTPINDFAFFYVTGWDGSGGNTNPCTADDPAPKGSIVGHFVKWVDTTGTPTPGDQACSFNSIGGCVAVMTR